MAEVDAGAVAPVIPAADAAPASESTADQVAQPDGGEKPEPPDEPKLTQAEVNKIVQREKAKAERRTERAIRAEVENEYLRRQIEDRSRQPQAIPPGKPTPEQFAGKPYEEYVDAVAEWKAKQIVEKELGNLRQESQQQSQARAAQEQDMALARKLSEGAAKYSDFKEVVGANDLPISLAMKAAIAKLPNPADVAYYLGSNVDEAHSIASGSDIDQVWAIKELSAKLSASAPTKTPAPIKPNSGSGSAPTGYRKDMTDKQFAEWRRQSRAKR